VASTPTLFLTAKPRLAGALAATNKAPVLLYRKMDGKTSDIKMKDGFIHQLSQRLTNFRMAPSSSGPSTVLFTGETSTKIIR